MAFKIDGEGCLVGEIKPMANLLEGKSRVEQKVADVADEKIVD